MKYDLEKVDIFVDELNLFSLLKFLLNVKINKLQEFTTTTIIYLKYFLFF